MSPGDNSPQLPFMPQILTRLVFAGLWQRQAQSGSQNGELLQTALARTTHQSEFRLKPVYPASLIMSRNKKPML
jgi:hypothetical protein